MALRIQLLLSCPCCGNSPDRFLPIPESYVRECEARGVEHPLDGWETLNLEAYLCPSCGATDRDRLQVLFLQSQWRPGMHVLEIAPGRPVSEWIVRHPGAIYRSCDIKRTDVDDRVDVTDMSTYPDGCFDIVICSHVLEHVPDDRKAIRELRRVLKPDGKALLLAPISLVVDQTVEDPLCEEEGERWRKFGQGDHVRIYNREGFEGRLREAGFDVHRYQAPDSTRHGLTDSSTLYVGTP